MMKYLAGVKYPVLKNGTIFITYDYMDPDYGGAHYGIDIISKKGNVLDYVVAMDAGTVTYVKDTVKGTVPTISSSDALGNNIKIKHADGTISHYCHLKYGSIVVKQGQTVKKGQVLAYIGCTGYSFGAHCHFQIWKEGIKVDPKPYLLGTAQTPVSTNAASNVPAKGKRVRLKNVRLFTTSSSTEAVKRLTGHWYIYDGKVINGRIRICPNAANVGKQPIGNNVTGFISAALFK